MKITTEQFLLNNLHNLKNSFTGIFDILDKARNQSLPNKDWPDYVYLPRMTIWKTISSILNAGSPLIKALKGQDGYDHHVINCMNVCESSVIFYNWRRNKKIYRISDELTKIICNIADTTNRYSINLPMDKFLNIDINGIFVKARISDNIYGFQVVIDYFDDNPMIIFYMFSHECDDDNYTKNIFVGEPSEITILEGKSIGECMDYTSEMVNKGINKLSSVFSKRVVDNFEMHTNISIADRNQMRALAILSYILDSDADIMPNPIQAQIYRKQEPNSTIKDKFREIESLDVGFGIKNTIQYIRGIVYNPNISTVIEECSSHNDTDAATINELKQEINRLKNHVSELSSENKILSKQLGEAQKKYSSLDDSIANERKELYDLRELVFNNRDKDEIKVDDTSSIKIAYPYTLKEKTIIIGGHVAWAINIRSKFNNIIVLDGTILPNDDLIKYANTIWIQIANLPHHSYYKVMNIARKYNIPIRYFTHYGVTKCAEQLVKNETDRI